jgi:hypothetical protein
VDWKEGQDADDVGRGSADQVINSWTDECFLLDAVMTWRVEDVMNADLFKKKDSSDALAPYYSLVLSQDTHVNNLLLAYWMRERSH